MSKFRTKSVVVEARQFTGDNADELVKWVASEGGEATYHSYLPAVRSHTGLVVTGAMPACISINTLDGDLFVNEDDWIIQPSLGDFGMCKAESFADLYDKADQ